MQPNELKALLSKTDEVAFRPAHVEVEISNQRNKRRQIYCPIGLIRGKVLQDGAAWIEKRVIAVCGDQDYEIKRKNGVLVEIDPADLPKGTGVIVGKNYFTMSPVATKGSGTKRNKKPYPHTVVVTRDGKKYIHMITSRKAIFTSWAEYELEIAKRKKIADEGVARDRALLIPQATLMGFSLAEFLKKHVKNTGERDVYLNREWSTVKTKKDKDGRTIYAPNRYGHEQPVPELEVGRIAITIDRANAILGVLTPAQKKKLGIPKVDPNAIAYVYSDDEEW